MQKYPSQLLPYKIFLSRLVRNIILGLLLIALALYLGMVGYHGFEKMSWVDAFVNAAMILSGMGPVSTLATNSGKIFAGCYALFSGLLFIMIIGVIYAPIINRSLHKHHLNMIAADAKRKIKHDN